MAAPARFLIVDDHPLFLEALQRAIISVLPNANTVEASTIEAAKAELSAPGRFDVVLLDLSLPDARGFDGLLELRGLFPKIPIVVVSALEDPRIVREVMSYGASGFVPKAASREEIGAALQEVMAGALTWPKGYQEPAAPVDTGRKGDLAQRLQSLTPKQLSVLKMLRQGLLNKQIAHELQIEETTVKAHVSEILRKLNVASRTQAVIEAQKIDFDQILGGDGS